MLAEIKDNEPDSLLYKVTHDIKGPLNSIIGLTNVAIAEIQDEKSIHFFNKIKLSAEKLNLFVDDLLNFTKISSRDTEKVKINFQEIINNILHSLQYLPDFSKIDISINIQQHIDFYSDATIIYSVIQNIIENSIKYYDESKLNPSLKIKIYINEERTTIEFDDNGIGIDENQQEKIFDMFFRATEKSTGNGIGLFIVKKSVEKLNGAISVKSSLGKGTFIKLLFENQN